MRPASLLCASLVAAFVSSSLPANAQGPVASGNIWVEGAPPVQNWVGDVFTFRPAIYVRGGLTPTRFAAINLPRWARLTADGAITGVPGRADVGIYSGIHLIVYVGDQYAMLGPLKFEVRDPASSPRVRLSWVAPVLNDDGSAVEDLRGYRILGARQGEIMQEIRRIDDPAATEAVVDRLDNGTWYFQVQAVTNSGVLGQPSRMVWKQPR